MPVAVWLPGGYPREAPLLFVEPTPDMMISPGHAFVDAGGRVRSSYAVNWDPARWPPLHHLPIRSDRPLQNGPLFEYGVHSSFAVNCPPPQHWARTCPMPS